MAGGCRSSNNASMASSSESASLPPSAPKNFTPLSVAGLCEALKTATALAPFSFPTMAAAPLGITPTDSTSNPADRIPEIRADSSTGPDSRVSRATRIFPFAFFSEKNFPAACPSAATNSGVMGSLPTLPRIPSVPNQRRRAPPAINGLPPSFPRQSLPASPKESTP